MTNSNAMSSSRRKRSRSCRITAWIDTSSAAVGSSRSFGRGAIARAIPTRAFWPPESWCGRRVNRSGGRPAHQPSLPRLHRTGQTLPEEAGHKSRALTRNSHGLEAQSARRATLIIQPGANSLRTGPNDRGRFGDYGGRFVAETLMPLILEVEQRLQRGESRSGVRGRSEAPPDALCRPPQPAVVRRTADRASSAARRSTSSATS